MQFFDESLRANLPKVFSSLTFNRIYTDGNLVYASFTVTLCQGIRAIAKTPNPCICNYYFSSYIAIFITCSYGKRSLFSIFIASKSVTFDLRKILKFKYKTYLLTRSRYLSCTNLLGINSLAASFSRQALNT